MAIKKLNQDSIRDASSSEIIAFAADSCGLDFSEDASREYMISAVCEAEGWVEANPEDNATHVVVFIAKEAGLDGHYGYRGGFNGKMFTIPRGVETEIPIGYYNTIRDSQAMGFAVKELDKFKEGSPNEERIEVSGVPISVLRWVNKGK